MYLNNFQSATTFAELALSKNVTNDNIKPWANYLLSEVYRKSNQDTKQAIFLKKALDLSDDFAEFYFSLGDYYINHQKEEKALEGERQGRCAFVSPRTQLILSTTFRLFQSCQISEEPQRENNVYNAHSSAQTARFLPT